MIRIVNKNKDFLTIMSSKLGGSLSFFDLDQTNDRVKYILNFKNICHHNFNLLFLSLINFFVLAVPLTFPQAAQKRFKSSKWLQKTFTDQVVNFLKIKDLFHNFKRNFICLHIEKSSSDVTKDVTNLRGALSLFSFRYPLNLGQKNFNGRRVPT